MSTTALAHFWCTCNCYMTNQNSRILTMVRSTTLKEVSRTQEYLQDLTDNQDFKDKGQLKMTLIFVWGETMLRCIEDRKQELGDENVGIKEVICNAMAKENFANVPTFNLNFPTEDMLRIAKESEVHHDGVVMDVDDNLLTAFDAAYGGATFGKTHTRKKAKFIALSEANSEKLKCDLGETFEVWTYHKYTPEELKSTWCTIL